MLSRCVLRTRPTTPSLVPSSLLRHSLPSNESSLKFFRWTGSHISGPYAKEKDASVPRGTLHFSCRNPSGTPRSISPAQSSLLNLHTALSRPILSLAQHCGNTSPGAGSLNDSDFSLHAGAWIRLGPHASRRRDCVVGRTVRSTDKAAEDRRCALQRD